MLESKVKIVNQLGLHARAAAQLVRLASTFESKITLKRADNSVIADAKSILSVLTMAARKGIEIILIVDGADEEKAIKSVEEIFKNGFGED
ncbi:MAG TPA: HPr family phosphocarrier protein [Pyrinomonadaceae bacterium]|nr:HPr family phosphocarrier protein [Pyrinomonadaceae bacterium]